jgi:hypothetical protein
MRHSLLLLPLAVVGLAGCVGLDSGFSRRTSADSMTVSRSATYMTAEQSATLMTLPGDTTAPVQMRYRQRAAGRALIAGHCGTVLF